jgi:hypothetical protein
MTQNRKGWRVGTRLVWVVWVLAVLPTHSAGPVAAQGAAAAAARRDLQQDERLGGHTIARHVGKTEADLRARLSRERISAASTYTDLETAETVVHATLEASAARLESWRARTGRRPNLALRHSGARDVPIGHALERGGFVPVPCYDAVVVLRWREDLGQFYVLTSYPEVRR